MAALRRHWPWGLPAAALLLLPLTGCSGRPTDRVYVGSKAFPESVLLGEMLCHLARDAGGRPVHRAWLGDTSKAWNGLLDGSLDVYCEYTGTLRKEVLEGEDVATEARLREALARRGLLMSRPLGFNNSYALAMASERAEALGINDVSDLVKHPGLKLGFSNQFVERGDGWAGLKAHYGLPHEGPRGLDHALVYEALKNGTLDVTDIYTTDAKVVPYGLRVLRDDRDYFPRYDAVILYRADLAG